ncbi:MAG: LysE family translocator [Pseudomonadota bacterium]
MNDLAYLIAPSLAFLIAAGSPGPATLAVAGTSMLRGRRAGLALAFGLTFGLAFWGAIAAAGFGAVLLHWAPGMLALRLLGGAYLLFLAWQSAKAALSNNTLAMTGAEDQSWSHIFGRGLLLNLTNPKALLAWAAVIALGIRPGSEAGEVPVIVAVCTTIGLILYLAYAVIFSTERVMFAYRAARRWIEGLFAFLFGAAGLKLILDRSNAV